MDTAGKVLVQLSILLVLLRVPVQLRILMVQLRIILLLVRVCTAAAAAESGRNFGRALTSSLGQVLTANHGACLLLGINPT